jgi:DNA-binding response OmpR family regulator
MMDSATSNRVWQRRASVWIADSWLRDYNRLVRSPQAGSMAIRLFATGRELLRAWRIAQPTVCFVHVRLPDLGGFDVVDMLRPFPAGTFVGMVANQYQADDEVHALSLGVHLYHCKPLDAGLLLECCRSRRAVPAYATAPLRPAGVLDAEREGTLYKFSGFQFQDDESSTT